MRKTLVETLTILARQDKDIFLITGDLGFSVFENFAQEFPDRFINCGIMEQSMMSIAAGMALSGKKPYVYSIIPFATMRPFEQIRNDICYQNLDVKIIGIGAGFAYGALGSTHYAIEDIAILRSLPNITIVSPADSIETKALILQLHKKRGAAYIRINKPETTLVPIGVKTILSKPSVIQDGKDGIIITTGERLETGIAVAEKLKNKGLHMKLISMHTLKPVDEKAFAKEVKNQKYLYTIEEHRMAGGLASIVAEMICRQNLVRINVKNFGVDNTYPGITSHQHSLAKHHGIDADHIYKKIIQHHGN
ncbi:MAG: 1-deoxy-D-xylulose-5-phosphate synthase [Candidatus Staskawiczbacteria bacterium]|nr:1-deoxy-D-xylulose-5-phosphate synthase [Candidatus Staskawiczbacteria bacterium]